MDSSAPEATSSTVASSIAEMKVDNSSSMITPSKNALFLSTYRRQNFTLPDSIMFYITKNPKNSEVYEKMIKTCKYFFIKNSIIVISGLRYSYDGWKFYIDRKGYIKVELKNCSSKLWLTEEVGFDYDVDVTHKNVVSLMILKIYRCDVKNLYLRSQVISYNGFMKLCSSVEHLDLHRVTVKYDDGTVVAFEKLIKQLSNVKEIYYTFSTPSNNTSKNTFKEIWKIPHFSNYDRFNFYDISEDFDIDSFYSFMKKNKNTEIVLSFSNTISQEYKTRLEAIIDEIIDTKNHGYKPPFINFLGINQEQFRKLYNIFCRLHSKQF